MNNEWIEYKGKKILYTVYSNQSKENMIEILKEQAEIVKSQPDKVLILDDFRDSYGSDEFLNLAKELGNTILNQKALKNAALGITGVKKILLKTYNLFTSNKVEPFDSKEEALEYLVK